MKKLLLLLIGFSVGTYAHSQVVCAGVSPQAIQGNYDFSVQANCGQWPGETDDGTWGAWNGGLNFNNPGDHIQGELMLVEDGTPGLNPQGNPISQEGCDSLINSLTNKIAVVYRNTCWFSSKIYYAEQAGAIGVIIVNREDGLLGMLGNTDPLNGPLGVDCHIPAVFISSIDGALLISEMNNGPVEMFIGNKLGAFNTDIGAVKGEFMIAPYGANNTGIFDGFDLGIQVYNYGINDLPNATVQATIVGNTAGVVYDQTVSIPLNSGDTAFVFNGNATEFPPFDLGGIGSYQNDDYTLTYTISAGGTDDFPFDNEYVAEFNLNDDFISSSRMAGGLPISNSYPSNSTTEYQSCMMVQDANFSNFYADGVYLVAHADTSQNSLAGAEIFVNAYQWDDTWVDLNDPIFSTAGAGFDNLNLLTYGTHYPASDNEVNQPVWVPFATAIPLQANVRYLFCAQTFESTTISFGYDNAIDYGANYSIYAQPVSPVHVDGTWYAAGWNGVSAPSLAIHRTIIGLEEENVLDVKAFPNPANDWITITANASGDANLRVVDVAGKLVYSAPVVLENGQLKVNISDLESGAYMFSLTTDEGQSAQFSVIKK